MMTGEHDALSAIFGRPLDHIVARAIVPDEIHVGSGEVRDLAAEVAREVERLEKNFRHHHCGAEIDHHAAREFRDHAARR